MHNTNCSFRILVVIGPSGSGKSTTLRLLGERQLVKVVPTWTTRPPRPEELQNDMEHKFVSLSEFQEGEKAGLILVAKQMFSLPYWYGLPIIEKPDNGLIPLIILRASLIDLFSKHYSNYLIYQIEDTLPRIRDRLSERKLFGEAIGSRLDDYENEIAIGRKMAKRSFINDGAAKSLSNNLKRAILEDFS